MGDALHPVAAGAQVEDPTDHGGLGRVDHALDVGAYASILTAVPFLPPYLPLVVADVFCLHRALLDCLDPDTPVSLTVERRYNFRGRGCSSSGPDAARLRGAGVVVIDAAGLRYVADTEHHRIVVFDPTGTMARTWGRFGREPGAFQYPRGLALDGAGTLSVADWGNYRIQQFTREGQFIRQFGGLRLEDFDGLFNATGVWAPHTGEIVVHAGDVYTFARDGRRLDTRRIPFQTETRCGIAVDAAGYVYVVGAPDHRVHKVDRDGRVLASFGRGRGEGDGELFDPRSASLWTLRAYVADWVRERGRVHAFAPDGSHLGTWSIGDDGQWLRSPQGLAVDTQGRLVVADRDLPAPMTITQGALIPEESLCTVTAVPISGDPAGGSRRFLGYWTSRGRR